MRQTASQRVSLYFNLPLSVYNVSQHRSKAGCVGSGGAGARPHAQRERWGRQARPCAQALDGPPQGQDARAELLRLAPGAARRRLGARRAGRRPDGVGHRAGALADPGRVATTPEAHGRTLWHARHWHALQHAVERPWSTQHAGRASRRRAERGRREPNDAVARGGRLPARVGRPQRLEAHQPHPLRRPRPQLPERPQEDAVARVGLHRGRGRHVCVRAHRGGARRGEEEGACWARSGSARPSFSLSLCLACPPQLQQETRQAGRRCHAAGRLPVQPPPHTRLQSPSRASHSLARTSAVPPPPSLGWPRAPLLLCPPARPPALPPAHRTLRCVPAARPTRACTRARTRSS
jgi:hypothetical protein